MNIGGADGVEACAHLMGGDPLTVRFLMCT